MFQKRIVVCLDVKEGRCTKGIKFKDNIDVGDPVEMAAKYYRDGADELVFYDITASHEKRGIMIDVVRKVAEQIFIPFSVGGGISTLNDIKDVIVIVLDNDVLYIGKNSSEAAVYSFTQKKRISEFSSDAHNLVANEKTFAYVAIDHHRYGLSHRISSTKKISIDFEMAGHLLIRDSDIFSTAHDGEDGWIVVNHEKKHKCTGAHTLKQKDGIVYGFINGIGLSRNFWIDKTNEVQTGPLIRTKEPYVIIEDDKPQYLAKSLFGRQILVHGETKKKSN